MAVERSETLLSAFLLAQLDNTLEVAFIRYPSFLHTMSGGNKKKGKPNTKSPDARIEHKPDSGPRGGHRINVVFFSPLSLKIFRCAGLHMQVCVVLGVHYTVCVAWEHQVLLYLCTFCS